MTTVIHVIAMASTLGLLSPQLHAGSPTSNCFDGETDRLFATDAVIAFGMSLDAKIPEIESDSDGRPTKLIWAPRPADTSIEVEQIGRYRDKGIYRVIYRKRSTTPEAPRPQVVCVMFCYQDTAPEGMGIRPFLVSADEQVSSIESCFTSEPEHPFALEVHTTLQGNGVYWSSYTFEFTPTEASIVERSEGGRRVHTKTYYYDKSGKTVKTETSRTE